MKISTKGRYALRMMLDLAENQHDGYVSLKDIAARQEILTITGTNGSKNTAVTILNII